MLEYKASRCSLVQHHADNWLLSLCPDITPTALRASNVDHKKSAAKLSRVHAVVITQGRRGVNSLSGLRNNGQAGVTDTTGIRMEDRAKPYTSTGAMP